MKRIILSTLFLGLIWEGVAQKPVPERSDYAEWAATGNAAITNDGQNLGYQIDRGGFQNSTLVLMATAGNWKVQLPGAYLSFYYPFSDDSQFAFVTKGRDSLGIVRLGSDSIEYIPHVRSFKLAGKGRGEWIAWLTTGRELIVRNLVTGSRESFQDVSDYSFDEGGSVLAVRTETRKDSILSQTVEELNLPGQGRKTVWQGGRAANLVFSQDGSKLAFLTQDSLNGQLAHSLWVYRVGAECAQQVADDHMVGIDSSLRLDRIRNFSREGERLFIDLRERDNPKPAPPAAKVDVWNYKDVTLQSMQLAILENPFTIFDHRPRDFAAVVLPGVGKVIRLEQDYERVGPGTAMQEQADSFLLIRHQEGDVNEGNWNPATRLRFYRVCTRDGKRVLLNRMPDGRLTPECSLSPDGRFAVYYDHQKRAWFSFEPASGITRNISSGVYAQWTDSTARASEVRVGFPVEGWMKDGETVLLREYYDIWKADLRGKHPPVCVTNGYGRKHRITFRLGSAEDKKRPLPTDKQILLIAFDDQTKDNGFYRMSVGENGDPRLLSMGPYLYYNPTLSTALTVGFAPRKARDTDIWLIQRQSAAESPNFFCTTDFQRFTPMSEVYPEKGYTWITSRLYNWRTPDGMPCQGVLYLPADFDPHKKYPLIFHYYERLSQNLHAYPKPGDESFDLDIAWYVTHGYLVFTPDIYYRKGHPGESIVNVVVSAAKYLAGRPWVDERRMGLQGGSFGGFETDYLVTHTHLFAAACSRSGIADVISWYGSVTDQGNDYGQAWAEIGQSRIGATLWQRPNLFLENTPLLKADQVTTPLLMVNNKGDGIVPFSQGVEFFTALRRLGKKAWMLQYDGESHAVGANKANVADLNIRLAQFFDHYLKGAPAPKWMVEGIPARLKGIDDGLELESGKP